MSVCLHSGNMSGSEQVLVAPDGPYTTAFREAIMSEQTNLNFCDKQSQVEYRSIVGCSGYRVGDDGTIWTRWMHRGGRLPDGSYPGGMKLGDKWKPMKQCRRGGNKAWCVTLRRDDGKCVRKYVHQLVLGAFVGPCPSGMVCRHGPHGKYDNHLYNLSWGTQKENIADKARDGTRVFGVTHHNAKMDPEKVRAARAKHTAGRSCLSLAHEFGISQTTMADILKRKTWREVA